MPTIEPVETLSLGEKERLIVRLKKELDRVRSRKYPPFSPAALADFDRLLDSELAAINESKALAS